MKKILWISHEAGRTGAPAVVLGLMQWLKQQDSRIQMTCVVMRDGPLRGDFEQICRTYTWKPTDLNQPERIHRRLAKVITARGQSDPGQWLTAILEKEEADIIYLSTLVLGKYLQQFPRRNNQRIITHVHELLPSLRQLSSDHLVDLQLNLSDRVICCAPCVQEMLMHTYKLSADKCCVIPEYIMPGESSSELKKKESPFDRASDGQGFLQTLSKALDQGIPVFGVGGNPIHRKGFDLLPLLVHECQRQFGDAPFLAVWIGCGEGSEARIGLEWDLTQMGLMDQVLLIPSVSMQTFRWIVSHFQVLTLLSREDPFPLVVLEAGLLGIPTVCFEGSGAIPSFAANEECVSVRYLDVPAFAAAIHQLCMNPLEARRIGAHMKARIERDLLIEKVAPQVVSVLLEAWDG